MSRARDTPLRRTRLRPVSQDRLDDEDAWRDTKLAVTARDRGRCQAEIVWPEVACSGRIDPHHVWPVGAGGPRCDVENVTSLCRAHHDAVHQSDPRRARKLGLLR
jgi:hypothetical protein